MLRVAINGFGRIGRNFLRALLADPKAMKQIEVVVINVGAARPDTIAHMFKYDTLMGIYPVAVTVKNNQLIVGDQYIDLIAECDPQKINWCTYKVDWVIESSGRFTQRDRAQLHLDSGATHVLISAPAKGEDITIIPGVNENKFNPQKDKIVSMGSCTTNAIVPMLKVLNDAFGVQDGFMTTIHSYTNTQVLIDVEDSDLRRSRAAALNIIPTTTGATKMIDKVLPELAGKMQGMAIRVPVAKVSIIDLTFNAEKSISVDAIHAAFKKVSKGTMQGIVDVSMEPLVSSDYSCSNYSVVIDGLLTRVQDHMGKVFGWYDNEWAYSVRLKDFLVYVSNGHASSGTKITK